MRVIECNECGEAVSAANDKELARRFAAHMLEEHSVELDADDLEELVDGEAYDAQDS